MGRAQLWVSALRPSALCLWLPANSPLSLLHSASPVQSSHFTAGILEGVRLSLAVIRMPVSTALLAGVSGSPGGLRQQTQVFASQALGFWLPDGGMGSNLTSDILVFHSCHIQILQPLKLNHNLLFRQQHWNLSFLPITTPTSPFFSQCGLDVFLFCLPSSLPSSFLFLSSSLLFDTYDVY